MALTPEQVRHIAKLARLQLTDADVTRLSTQLTGILEYVDMLKEVDTSSVEATSQVTGLENVLRADEVRTTPIATPEDLLACSPLPVVERQVQTQSAH
jgi:aspartyl-tRNA(Asn)/glutamyl-tRNA(Gln) amidotransferase subunit C